MNPNPMLGVVFHWLGGLASGSFYVPYRGVKKWSWETYWLVGGFFSWIIAPWVLASLMTKDLVGVLQQQTHDHAVVELFLWRDVGIGRPDVWLDDALPGHVAGHGDRAGLLRGLRHPGAADLQRHDHGRQLSTPAGQIVLFGVLVCLLGIGIAGLAGMNKEREMPEEKKRESIKEFNFTKGILVGTFSGILSASFAYALAAAEPIADGFQGRGNESDLDRAAEAGGRPAGRLHQQLHLVRSAEHQKRLRLSILHQSGAARSMPG